MFDIGFSEVMLIGLLGLLVLGPERLPAVARQIGRYVGRARTTWNAMRTELEREIEQTGVKDIKDDISGAGKELQSSMQESKQALDETRQQVARQTGKTDAQSNGKSAANAPAVDDSDAADQHR
jgi:sec-independent protein translocase protein TatB